MTDTDTMLESLDNFEQRELATVLRVCAQLVIGRMVTTSLVEYRLVHLWDQQIPAFQARVKDHLIRRPLSDGMNSDLLEKIMNYITEEQPSSMMIFVAGELTYVAADNHRLPDATKVGTDSDLADFNRRFTRNHEHLVRQGLKA